MLATRHQYKYINQVDQQKASLTVFCVAIRIWAILISLEEDAGCAWRIFKAVLLRNERISLRFHLDNRMYIYRPFYVNSLNPEALYVLRGFSPLRKTRPNDIYYTDRRSIDMICTSVRRLMFSGLGTRILTAILLRLQYNHVFLVILSFI